jgi:hypothetical protein
MHKTSTRVGMALLCMTVMAVAEPQTPAPRTSVNVQLNTDFLNDLMRSAIIFNGMVQNLNLNKTLRDSGVSPDSTDANGRQIKHAAAVLGAGAGVGLAVGGMTGSQKGAMIGAVAGSAGAFVIDQIVQHQAKARLANADNYRDNNRDNNRDNPQYNDREPQRFKERAAPQQ